MLKNASLSLSITFGKILKKRKKIVIWRLYMIQPLLTNINFWALYYAYM